MEAIYLDPQYWDNKAELQVVIWQHSEKRDNGPRHLAYERSDEQDRPFWIWTLWTLVLAGLAVMITAMLVAYSTGSGAALLWVVVAMVLLYLGAKVWDMMIVIREDADEPASDHPALCVG